MEEMQAQIQMLIADVATAQTAAAAAQRAASAAAAAAAARVVAPVPIPVLYSGRTMMAIPLKYKDPPDLKIFKAATASLNTLIDLKSADRQIFLKKVKSRVRIYNWADVFLIPDDDGIPRNLLQQYGLLSLENYVAAANTYVNPPTCLEQNSTMAFLFLQES